MAVSVRHLRRVATPAVILPHHLYDPNDPLSFNGPTSGFATVSDIGSVGGQDATRASYPDWVTSYLLSGAMIFDFNGVNDFYFVGSDIDDNVGFTFSAWLSQSSSNVDVVNVVLANASSNEQTLGFKLLLRESEQKIGVELGDGTTGTKIYGAPFSYYPAGESSYGQPMQNCTWRFDRANSAIDMWVNGVKSPTRTLPAGVRIDALNGKYQIGRVLNSNSFNLLGGMGSFAMWNTPVSEASILSFYNSTKAVFGQ